MLQSAHFGVIFIDFAIIVAYFAIILNIVCIHIDIFVHFLVIDAHFCFADVHIHKISGHIHTILVVQSIQCGLALHILRWRDDIATGCTIFAVSAVEDVIFALMFGFRASFLHSMTSCVPTVCVIATASGHFGVAAPVR